MMEPGFPPTPREVRRFFRGLKIRIGATVALFVGGLSWILLYLAFYAGRFSWFQNLAVILVSLAAVPTAVVAIWVSWGLSAGRRFHHRFWSDDFP